MAGRRARIPRGRALSLLALLLVHRGAVVHHERVVDELWDGAGPRHARNAVHGVASRLRSALGDGAIVSEGGGYGVAPAPGAVDADRRLSRPPGPSSLASRPSFSEENFRALSRS